MGGRIAMLLAVTGCRFGFAEVQPGAGGDASAGSGDGSARTYLFEDGFEDTLAPWLPLGDVMVEGGPPLPVAGAGALRAQANSASSSRAEVLLPRTVGYGGDVFVRGYYYLPSGYPISDLSLLEIVQATTENLVVTTVPELGLYNSFANDGGASAFVLPRDVWLCIETHVLIADAPDGAVEIRVDDVLQYQLNGSDTFAGGIDELHTGVTWAGAGQAPSIVYVDDVIADDVAPIGCR